MLRPIPIATIVLLVASALAHAEYKGCLEEISSLRLETRGVRYMRERMGHYSLGWGDVKAAAEAAGLTALQIPRAGSSQLLDSGLFAWPSGSGTRRQSREAILLVHPWSGHRQTHQLLKLYRSPMILAFPLYDIGGARKKFPEFAAEFAQSAQIGAASGYRRLAYATLPGDGTLAVATPWNLAQALRHLLQETAALNTVIIGGGKILATSENTHGIGCARTTAHALHELLGESGVKIVCAPDLSY